MKRNMIVITAVAGTTAALTAVVSFKASKKHGRFYRYAQPAYHQAALLHSLQSRILTPQRQILSSSDLFIFSDKDRKIFFVALLPTFQKQRRFTNFEGLYR